MVENKCKYEYKYIRFEDYKKGEFEYKYIWVDKKTRIQIQIWIQIFEPVFANTTMNKNVRHILSYLILYFKKYILQQQQQKALCPTLTLRDWTFT